MYDLLKVAAGLLAIAVIAIAALLGVGALAMWSETVVGPPPAVSVPAVGPGVVPTPTDCTGDNSQPNSIIC